MGNNANIILKSKTDLTILVINYILLIGALIIVAYPVYFVLVASVSDSAYVNSGAMLLWPKGFQLRGYSYVFSEKRIWTGYANTILYTVCGTSLGLFCSLLAGYALSRRTLPGRSIIMVILVFTMYFSGGLIPFYLVVKSVNLLNTRLVLIIIGSISVYNIILIRSFFIHTIPIELQEAAAIDGCGYGNFFFKVVLPLSKAISAVIALYLAVAYWSSYFNALIFVTNPDKVPLQLILREILLVSTESIRQETTNAEAMAEYQKLLEVIKYALIVVATLPVMCVYPFLQKHFVQGVMIGSLKG